MFNSFHAWGDLTMIDHFGYRNTQEKIKPDIWVEMIKCFYKRKRCLKENAFFEKTLCHQQFKTDLSWKDN